MLNFYIGLREKLPIGILSMFLVVEAFFSQLNLDWTRV